MANGSKICFPEFPNIGWTIIDSLSKPSLMCSPICDLLQIFGLYSFTGSINYMGSRYMCPAVDGCCQLLTPCGSWLMPSTSAASESFTEQLRTTAACWCDEKEDPPVELWQQGGTGRSRRHVAGGSAAAHQHQFTGVAGCDAGSEGSKKTHRVSDVVTKQRLIPCSQQVLVNKCNFQHVLELLL